MIFKEYKISDYAMSMGAPEMNAITTCFWVNTKQQTGYAFYISYAASNALQNQFIVGGHSDLKLEVNHAQGAIKVYSRYNMHG